MADLTAQRTLVKSTPELWSELSEVESLAKHLGELGEIRITKVEPETTVAWEGEQISGTVRLEQSGWGTKVTFHATVPEPDLPEPEPNLPEPDCDSPPEAEATPVSLADPAHEQAEPEPELEVTPVEADPALEQDEPRRERGNFITRWLFRERRAARAAAAESRAAVSPPELVQEQPTLEFEPVAIESDAVALAEQSEPVVAEPEAVAVEPEPAPAAPESPELARVRQVLDGTLEALGQAHHRPFSRG